jgi:molybdopterin/thiamine biosynthesis adenylyltransferase
MTPVTISIDDMTRLATHRQFPDKTPYRSISVEHVRQLAAESGASGRDVEIAALENGIVPERYARNMRTCSLEDQTALLRARVGIVGLGGLGGTVAEVLARMGVGRLRIVDGDRFEDSNLNRQLLSTIEGMGQLKSEAARARVARINPSVDVTALTEFVTAENAGAVLAGCDVVVDCLDNLHTRFVVEDACRRIGCPLVSAAVAGASGHVTTIFPAPQRRRDVPGYPALRRHLPGDPGMRGSGQGHPEKRQPPAPQTAGGRPHGRNRRSHEPALSPTRFSPYPRITTIAAPFP